jgi:hypothetical protein
VGKIELILADAYNSHLSYNFKIPANPKVDQLVDLLIKQVVQRSSNSKLLRKKNICLKKMFFRKASFLAAAFIGSGCLVQHDLRFVVHRRDRFVVQAEERHIKIDPSNDVAKNRFDNNNKKQKRKSCVIVVGTTGKT